MLNAPIRAGSSFYAHLGRKPGIDGMVYPSVDNYLADPSIKNIFSASNIDRIRAELEDQFRRIADGPCRTGHSVATAHEGLHLTNADFHALVEDPQSAMDICKIPFAIREQFLVRQVMTR